MLLVRYLLGTEDIMLHYLLGTETIMLLPLVRDRGHY